MTRIKSLLVIVSLVAIDQLFKHIVRHSGGFYICNPGIAFGIQIPEALFWLVYAVIIGLAIYLFLKKNQNLKDLISSSRAKSRPTGRSRGICSQLTLTIFIGRFLHFTRSFLARFGRNDNHNLSNSLNSKFLIHNTCPIILILSGAFSNLIDRLCYGCVIDFIDLKFWPIFNLADAFITIGGIMIVICLLKYYRRLRSGWTAKL